MADFERTTFYGLNIRDRKFVSGKNDTAKFREASDISNILLQPGGGFGVFPGRNAINSSPMITVGHSADWFKDYQDVEHLMIGVNDQVLDAVDGGPVPSVSLTGLTADQKSHNADFKDFLFFCNGTDDNLKFDGTAWTRWAIPAPSIDPVLADGGAGALTGTFQYVYNYSFTHASGYESESAISDFTEIVVAGKQIDVTVVVDPTGDATGIRIWRRSNTFALYKFVTELPNANATYTDNNTDISLRANVGLSEGFEGFPGVAFDGVEKWKNRLWAWKGDTLFWTTEHQPEKFYVSGDEPGVNNASNFQPFILDGKIVVVKGFKNKLTIHTDNNEMWSIVGDREENFTLYLEEDVIGTNARRSIVNTGTYMFWQNVKGVTRWDAYNKPVDVSKKINKDNEGQSRGLLEANDSFLPAAAAVYDPIQDLYLLSVPFGGNGFNSRTFVYHLEMAFTKAKGDKEELSPWSLTDFGFTDAVNVSEKKIISLDSKSNNYVLELIGTTDIDSVEMVGHYETTAWDNDKSKLDKRLGFLTVSAYSEGRTITFKTKFWRSNGSFFESTFTLSNSLDKWGPDADQGNWGPDADQAIWGGASNLTDTTDYEQEAIGAYIAYRAEMDAGSSLQSFEINDIGFEERDLI